MRGTLACLGLVVAASLPVVAAASTVTYDLDLTVTGYTGPDPFGFTSAPQSPGQFIVSFDSSALVPAGTLDPPIVPLTLSGEIGNVSYTASCFTSGASGPCQIATDASANFSGFSWTTQTPVQPLQCDPNTSACRETAVQIRQSGTWTASDFFNPGGPSEGSLSGTYTIVPATPTPLPSSLSELLSGLLSLCGVAWLFARRAGGPERPRLTPVRAVP